MAVKTNGGPLEFDAVIYMQQFEQQLNRIERGLRSVTDSANNEAKAIEGLARRAVGTLGLFTAGFTATSFVSDVARVRGEFQQLEVAFTTMLGSKEKADKLMAQVTQFAATTPFELQEVAAATKQLLAFGISADRIEDTLRSLGDISAGIGAPLGEIAYLFGTIKTQGVAMTQDIRQFANRGIPIYEELAKVLGVSVEEVGKLVTAGKVGFKEIEAVFQSLTAEGSKFGGLMEAQSKTITGLQSNLSDAWARMLNDIGKTNEGIIASSIKGAIAIVENYETVLDILKVLVLTYGSYRAAIIATTAVQSIQTAATKGYTIAETLRFQAMLISEKVMKLLNRTMLANPAVAVTAGVMALVSALVVFGRAASNASKVQATLNEVQAESQRILIEEKNRLQDLLAIAKDETRSKTEREAAMRKINAISPEYLGNLTLEKLRTDEGKKAIEEYIKALDRKAQAQAANAAITKLYEEKIAAELKRSEGDIDVADRLGTRILSIFDKNAANAFSAGIGGMKAQGEIDLIEQKIEKIKSTYQDVLTEQLTGEPKIQGEKKRTLAVIDEEIKALKDQQAAQSTNSKQFQDFQAKINALEAERARIAGASKAQISASNALENQTNSILEQRKTILQSISDLQRDAQLSGLTKERSEIERISDKYTEVLNKVAEYNKKVDEFNKKTKSNVSRIGQEEINKIVEAKTREIDNATQKQQAEEYKKSIDEQREIFDRFEQYKETVGIEKARQLLGEQTGEFESYLDFLRAELEKFRNDASIGGQIRFTFITETLAKGEKDAAKKAADEQFRSYQDILSATVDFNDKKAEIDRRYSKLSDGLEKNRTLLTVEEYERRKKALQSLQSDELKGLQNSFARQTELYKKLGEDVIRFSRQQLQARIRDLKNTLETDTSLTPQMRADVKSTIDQLTGLLIATDEASVKLTDFIEQASQIKNAFDNLVSAASGLNKELDQTLQFMSNILGSALEVADSLKQFNAAKASGDSIGQVAAGANIAAVAINTIRGIVQDIKNAKDQKRSADEAIADFQIQLIKGEQEYQALLRERSRAIILNNKLTLEGLQAQRELLQQQRQANQQAFDDIFKKLQSESFVKGLTKDEKKNFESIFKGLAGIFGAKTISSKEILESLSGKNFQQLEELFMKGQLTGRARELFEQLQKIKQEGADIDAMLEENRRRMQEVFTGTTADSILDSIVDGFKNGLHSAADFASTFEELMRGAIINSLKYKYLEGPIKEFFEEFAAASESDSTLTQSEIDQLNQMFNTIIQNADEKFKQLQQVAGLNFGNAAGSGNSLQGAIRGMTEQTAELIAGQFGGLRLTAVEQLNVAKQSLVVHQAVQNNTALTVVRLETIISKLDHYYNVVGIKVQ